MDDTEAESALVAANCSKSSLPPKIRDQLRHPNHWSCYEVAGHQLLIFKTERGEVGQLVISGEKVVGESNRLSEFWIPLEVIHLEEPLKDGWNWAFHEKWSWNPAAANDKDILQCGQHR